MANGSLQRRQFIRRRLSPTPQADGKVVARIAAHTWSQVVSYRSAAIAAKRAQGGENELQRFVQQLAITPPGIAAQ
jgi:hypothetical protein